MKDNITKLLLRLNSENEENVVGVIQQLTSYGDEILDACTKGISDNNNSIEALKKVISYIAPPRDIDKLSVLAKSNNPNLVIAACQGLALSEEINALACLYQIYENTWHKELAVKSIGKLGFAEAENFLIGKIGEVFNRIEPVLKSSQAPSNDEDFDESDLSLFIELLRALKRIGKQKYLEYLTEIINYNSRDEYSDKNILRSRSIQLIGEIPSNNCISTLISSLSADYFEIRESALWALYLIATPKAMEPLFNCSPDHKIALSNRLFWCLKQWSGMNLKNIDEYRLWWKEHGSLFEINACYKLGDLMSIENLIMNLGGEVNELQYKFKELEIYTNIDFYTCLYRNPELSLIEKTNALLKSNEVYFERGKHYRFGRFETPDSW